MIVTSPIVIVKDHTGSDVPSQINPLFVKDKLLPAEYEVISVTQWILKNFFELFMFCFSQIIVTLLYCCIHLISVFV